MILTYEDFLLKEGHMTVEESKANLLMAIAERCSSQEERDSLRYYINEGFTNDLFDIATSLEESFAAKFKEMAAKAAERAKELGKSAKEKLSDGGKMALKFGGNIMAALKAVLGKIKAVIAKMWEFVKTKAMQVAQSEQSKLQEILDPKLKNAKTRKTLAEEAQNMGSIAKSVVKFIGTDFVEDVAKSGAAAATESVNTMTFDELFEASFYASAAHVISEGYSLDEAEKELIEFNAILEGDHGDGTSAKAMHIPFISTIMKKLSSFPPFNLLHKVEAMIAKGAEKGLNAFSQFATKVADAPGPFTFPVTAGIVSIIAGYMIEQNVKNEMMDMNDVLIKALGFGVPGIGALYTFMKYGGITLASYGIIKNLLGKYEEKKEKPEEKTSEK